MHSNWKDKYASLIGLFITFTFSTDQRFLKGAQWKCWLVHHVQSCKQMFLKKSCICALSNCRAESEISICFRLHGRSSIFSIIYLNSDYVHINYGEWEHSLSMQDHQLLSELFLYFLQFLMHSCPEADTSWPIRITVGV